MNSQHSMHLGHEQNAAALPAKPNRNPSFEREHFGTRPVESRESRESRAEFPAFFESDSEFSEYSSSTILLVDDDPDIRSLTRTFLQHIGFRVLTAGDADRALHIFHTAPGIDLLIADQNLPHRTASITSGMELALALKSIHPELPVLMISASVLEQRNLGALAQPGWSFLPKPFSLPDLLAAVHTILQTS